jgi:DMSO/TMAO reductase YedYZ molybdopterin-dependent catalytic subunit
VKLTSLPASVEKLASMPPPPGPFRREFWRSPLRGPWLTSFLGSLLFMGVVTVGTTGFLSHAAYQPDLGRNALINPKYDFQPFIFGWPSSPSWLYALNQGLHVTVGVITVPFLLAKLWSVIPRLFAWPPVKSVAMSIERLLLLLFVGSAFFEFTTGILNVQLFYPWHFVFIRAHYYGAWVFLSALTAHVLIKLPVIIRAFTERGIVRPLREDLAHTLPEPPDPDGLAPVAPAEPTLTRRGLIGVVSGASLVLLGVTAGQSVGGPLRRLALLAPRGRVWGTGANDFPVNITAGTARIAAGAVGPSWRLTVKGQRELSFSREQLLAMPLESHRLPIACVEGWSTTQKWTGVRLSHLAAMAEVPEPAIAHVESLQGHGAFRQTTLNHDQANDSRALLALRVNDADLSMDHGYPARIVVPALPGVHCTKWVESLQFEAA